MTNHLITEQLIADRQAAARARGAQHRLARAGRATPRSPVPAPGTEEFRDWAGAFAHRVAAEGLDPVERQVADLCRLARRHRVAPTCADIAVDRRQPAVARQRAVGRLLTALATQPPERAARSDVA